IGGVAVGSGAGGAQLSGGVVTAAFSDSSGSFSLSGRVESAFAEPSVEAELVLSGRRIESLAADPDVELPEIELTGTLAAEGPIEGFSVGGSLLASADHARASVSVDGIVGFSEGRVDASLDVRSPDAVVRGVELPFSAVVLADEERLAVESLELGDLADVRIEVSRDEEKGLSGSVVASEADLRDLVAVLGDVELPESVEGLVFASVSLSGTPSSPGAEGQVQIGSAAAMGVEHLSAVFAGRLLDGVVEIEEMGLEHAGARVVDVRGTAALGGELRISVVGEEVPGPLLGGGPETGFNVSIGIGGDRTDPTLDGLVEARDGSFLDVPFDDFMARVTGAAGVLRVDPLSLEKRGVYRARAVASAPLSALLADPGGEEATVTAEIDGDPLALLAEMAPYAERARGTGRMQVVLVGTREDVSVAAASLSVSDGTILPAAVLERIEDVEVDVEIADGRLERGRISGRVGGEPIRLEAARPGSGVPSDFVPLELAGIDVGVLALSTADNGVRASIPGLMLPEDVGRVVVRGREDAPALLMGGPSDRPTLWGELTFHDMSFTYPLLESDADVGGLLSGATWSLQMTAGRNLWYWRPDAELKIERGNSLEFRGVPEEGSLCVFGRVESQTGTVTYANNDFDVREASIDFPFFCEPPRFYVLAETRVEDGTTISLTMDSYEGAFAGAVPGATFDDSELRLASDSPEDDNREEILSKLQYGVSYELLETEEQASLERRRALEVVGTQLSGRIVRPLLSPVEGRIKRALNLDLVRFEIDFLEHFLAQLDLWHAQEAGAGYQPFLTDTRVTLGKYISGNWLLSYVGHADAYEEELGDERLGFRQELGVEYEVSRNTSLSMRVVYDPALAGWDRRVTVENRFRF
ncbi:MAG: hypothetical protein GF400_00175, partial [Candidatus Eisenbacteria bacterium]|nr:hypothetical protein [Candidatus Eisenbacteria bacterium]